MERIISVNLGVKMFQIEEDAYKCLKSVIRGNRKKLELEAEIAEGLERKLYHGKSIITYPDVVDVLYKLGFSAADYQTTGFLNGRLFRQPKNKIIAGICTGFGDYFGIDPVIVRVIFVLSLFMVAMGFWIYIVLWIIIPNVQQNGNDVRQ